MDHYKVPRGVLFKKMILLSESPECQEVSEVFLKRSFPNMEIGLASNGLEALRKLWAQKPWVLITELRLPVISGLEVAEWANKNLRGMKIIGTTTRPDLAERAKGFCDRVFLKPYQLKEVAEWIKGK